MVLSLEGREKRGNSQPQSRVRNYRGQGIVVTGTPSLSASAATTKCKLFRLPLGCAPSLGSSHAAGPSGSCSLREVWLRRVGAGQANAEGGRALTFFYLLCSQSILHLYPQQ